MKSFRYITVVAAIFAMFSCKNYEPIKIENRVPIQPTHSIKELIEEFGTEKGIMLPVRPNSGEAGLYSVDLIPLKDEPVTLYKYTIETKGVTKPEILVSYSDDIVLTNNQKITKKDKIVIPPYGSDITIVGRVISDDSQGNYYKAIAIQDLTNPKLSLKISVEASGIGAWYAVGQVISIRCNGLVIGKYADMYQLGTVYFNNNSDPNKRGYEPGRIPLPMFKVRATTYSEPELNKIVVDTLTITDILNAATDRTLHSRLICIKNIHFTQSGDAANDIDQPKDRIIFAPSTNGVGYPQSIEIADTDSKRINICTSEYARFCNTTIPSAEYVGKVTAVIGWYRDKAQYGGNVQLTIRSLNDLELYSTEDGSKWVPKNY